MPAKTLLLFAALLSLPSCSALVSGNYPLQECAADTDCADLSAVSGNEPADDCHTWQCNPDTHACELDLIDRDGDGFAAMLSPSMAVCTTESVDCNDDPTDELATATNPAALESCNGLDDDCDGLLDEGQISTREGETEPRASCVGNGTDPDLYVAGAAALGGAGIVISLTRIVGEGNAFRYDGYRGGNSLHGTVRGTEPTSFEALAPISASAVSILLHPAGGACRRLALAHATIPDALSGGVYTAGPTEGLPVPDATGCAPTQLGAVAADTATAGLVAYLSVPSDAVRTCSGAAAAVDVLVTTADLPTATPGATAEVLGQSVDYRPPGLARARAGTFLVAFPTSANAIEVHEVTTMGGITQRLVHTEAPGGTPRAVTLTTGGPSTFLLSWASDGCDAGPLNARELTVGAGAVTAGALLVTSDDLERPHGVHQPDLDEWLLLGRDAMGDLRGERFTRDGTAIGPSFHIADDVLDYAAVAPVGGPAYALVTNFDARATPPMADPVRCAARSTFGCVAR